MPPLSTFHCTPPKIYGVGRSAGQNKAIWHPQRIAFTFSTMLTKMSRFFVDFDLIECVHSCVKPFPLNCKSLCLSETWILFGGKLECLDDGYVPPSILGVYP